jgi:hypothetical protein
LGPVAGPAGVRRPFEVRRPCQAAAVADDDARARGSEFELDEWSMEDRELLDRLLTGEGIAHVWQGSTVVVSPADVHRADDLIDQVEEEAASSVVQVGAGAGAGDGREGVLAALDGDGDDGDEDWDDWDGGVDAQEVLGGAFVAADRLARRASDPDGVVGMVDAQRAMAAMELPFGFEAATWDDLVARVDVLGTALTVADGDDDALGAEEIEELAGDLRAVLRPIV